MVDAWFYCGSDCKSMFDTWFTVVLIVNPWLIHVFFIVNTRLIHSFAMYGKFMVEIWFYNGFDCKSMVNSWFYYGFHCKSMVDTWFYCKTMIDTWF